MNRIPEYPDLIEKSRSGDMDAYGELVTAYQAYVMALALRFLSDREDARDIVQETFLRVWQNLSRFDERRSRFSTWVYRIAVNLCLDRIKTARRRKNREEAAGLPDSPCPDPETVCLQQELVDQVLAFSRRLPSRQQAVFILRDLMDMEIAAIAELLQTNQAAVKSNLCAARRTLRRLLPAPFETSGVNDAV